MSNPQKIKMSELNEIRLRIQSQKSPDELILDVRSQEEFKSGHIAGARNIAHDQVLSHVDELRKFKRVYIHCQGGVRAARAAEALAGRGLTNLSCATESGMGEWISLGLPIEK